LKNKIKNYKNFDKKLRKTIKNQNKMDKIEITIIIEKKNLKLDLKDKIASHIQIIKKLKVKGPN
jgi:hypothetical protein